MHFFSPIKLKTNNNCCEGSSRKYNEPVFQTHFSAGVAELVDAVDSKSTAFGCAGSSPAFGTIRTSRDVNRRLFLYLKSQFYKAFPSFSVFPSILRTYVPLSRQTIDILKQVYQFCGNHSLVFIDNDNPRENTVNSALRVMGYDTKTEVCEPGFRTMACSSLIESGLWLKDTVERQMSHQ